VYAILQDNISEKVEQGLIKLTFLSLGSTAAVSQCLEAFSDKPLLFFLILIEDQNVAKVGNAGTVDVYLQNVLDTMLKRGWGVA
jgi:disulfide oxidoreductase YuzD